VGGCDTDWEAVILIEWEAVMLIEWEAVILIGRL